MLKAILTRPCDANKTASHVRSWACYGGAQTLRDSDYIGKVVLKMSQDGSAVSSVHPTGLLSLDPEGSCLLAGGLGGLGRSIATWMIKHGARSLIFLSRNAGLNGSDRTFFEELVNRGCAVSATAGMTQNMEDVKKGISSAPNSIKGVIQLAMVLRVCHLSFNSRILAPLTQT